MKGGITWTEVLMLSSEQRITFIERINKRNKEASGDAKEYL